MIDFKDKIAPWVAIVAIASFGAALVFLIRHVNEEEPQWSRLVFIFGGVEAAGLAALGFFFGKEVNRARAEKAEDRAQNAEQDKVEANTQRAAAQQSLQALNAIIEQKRAQWQTSGTLASDILAGFERASEVGEQFPDLLSYLQQPRRTERSKDDWEELAGIARRLAEGQ